MIDPSQQIRSIEGFGYALTGGCAELLVFNPEARTRILRRIFTTEGGGLGVNQLRLRDEVIRALSCSLPAPLPLGVR